MKTINDTSKMRHYWEKPDLFFYEITDKTTDKFFTINSIENLLNQYDKNNGTPDDVFICGLSNALEGDQFRTVSPMTCPCKIYGDLTDCPTYKNINKPDFLNYLVDKCPPNGYSGSPVYFKISVPNSYENVDKLTFGGVYFASTSGNTGGRVVRPEEILNFLNSIK